MPAIERARCQHLVFGVVRHFSRIGTPLEKLVAHPPRFATRAILFVAGFELIEALGKEGDEGQPARIVHHAVERTKGLASPDEARLVNAVVRKLATMLSTQRAPAPIAGAEELAEFFSHPVWLVRRWLATFGAGATRKLLEWNQAPASLHARWRGRSRPPADWLQPTEWRDFFTVPPGRWPDAAPLLQEGLLYIQDPATRLAVELLDPRPGEEVLDLCAAPGGKSLLIADSLGTGRVISLDLATSRIDRLTENLARTVGVGTAVVQADLLDGAPRHLAKQGLPGQYPAILLDVPCSNTGVMRHRVDVKWRLQEGDFAQHARQQGALLAAASRLLAPGGRLVYSTCSIDPAENERVVESFLDRHRGFALRKKAVAVPWIERHDGVAAFLLQAPEVPLPRPP